MNENKPSRFSAFWFYAGLALILFFILNPLSSAGLWKQPEEIPQTEFEKFLQDGDISKVVVVNKHQARIYLFPEAMDKPDHKKVRAESPLFKTGEDSDVPQYRMEIGVLENFENRFNKIVAENNLSNTQLVYRTEQNFVGDLLITVVLPLVLFVGLWIFLMRRAGGGFGGGQFFNIGRSRAKLFDGEKDKKITFQDVAGLEGAKEEVQEIVDFLKNPEKYTSLGGKIPKGALLVGPPGTGKTLLAKAVAGEAQVPFFSLSGSDFVEMFVGVGASRVRDLFRQAKEKSPSIIFIDEIDAIGRARGKNNLTNANDERENTLNQLLTEMDGFGTNTNVIVLAATNRADILDKALLRAGRFDRQIYVDLPDLNERKEIFKVHLRPIKVTEDLDVEFLAKQTPGFSGADIANVCNEAALIAARRGKTSVDKQDFLDAVDRIIGGLEKKNKIITPEEKKAIAYHEAGHATVSWLLEHAAPLVKVTIVPRGRSLGAAWYLPEERQIVRTDQIQDEMCAALGGRAAEEITFGKISTGALSDLEKVTKQARAMVTIYGLNDKIGNLTYYDPTGEEYGFTKPYSEKTAQVIDEEIREIIEQQYQRALDILRTNREKLTTLAELLLEREVIFKEDLEHIFGKRPHDNDK
ncbi:MULTISPECIES: ATP-dependent zinc metalloprotease FtsH [Capnocytophaga]|jgi:ATP-dependent metallopeptidase hflB|uniref:ATP-dependent zinc metalloprotease FtsH n=1 Tax=Capnocytophaga granulosa TaxID=45242 RepID=A0A1H2YWZ8_9FLAO|nr:MULTISPECIES: ATP-dependent zinc metalloprotease FtsH [Capnocytophaga]RKW10488.1 MAG: ATP-dependent metallopeptidase FtsH/Yme1/Tma family protein [Capnocytophaga sp.]EJU30708.1 ATP-dependent metallopeptidase HflB [Capnocytophaga sp. CM59]EPD27366.1 ATP-dependent metallopeptidase HflB [Capnocytophaga granulosa ATCC 51502]SDX09693.1 cell division protease FtsH [Capnocytophaga granulosa]SUX14916.1 ATP-dependent zinc metalloprotease FtsH 3 [Capnocytophaga granulosa]